jgi:hypothetical protein
VLSGLELVLVVAAVAAGLTGAWSPCGLSMVETLAPQGYAGRLRTSLVACATFTAGALAGGVATFGALALAGRALGAGSGVAMTAAAVLALVAAAGEARGARILPQIRRQVPESWRRVLPVPLAAGLYGVLLGLGFTTFVLTFAVWALAAVSLALGDPVIGAVLGVAFGAGRALPVIALAPVNGTAWGAAAHAAMAERPGIYRGLRALDAAALVACAAVLVTSPAQAATSTLSRGATDPSADGIWVAYDRPGAAPVLEGRGERRALPGRDPQVAAGQVAWREGETVVIADARTLAEIAREPVPGADAFAFDEQWIVWRQGARLLARARGLGLTEIVHDGAAGDDVGPPSLHRDRVVFHVATARGSEILEHRLTDGRRLTLRRAPAGSLLVQPTLKGRDLLYVRSSRAGQELRLGRATERPVLKDRVLYATTPTARRDDGHEPGLRPHTHRGAGGWAVPRQPARPREGVTATLYSTALTRAAAYVTRVVLEDGVTSSRVLQVDR